MKKYILAIIIIASLVSGGRAGFLCGDVNFDGNVNILDITNIIAYLYQGGPAPYFYAGNVNRDDAINILDITALINFLYKDGPDLNCTTPPYPGMAIVDSSDCLNMYYRNALDSTPFDSSCVDYEYDGQGNLLLVHHNAGLNCCQAAFAARMSIGFGMITITEIDSVIGDGCPCLCLYDLSFQLYNILPGTYFIRFIEPMVGPQEEQLEFIVDLTGPASGRHCVYRNDYPWGEW